MTQIRVHELASELGLSTQQVLSFLEELGQKVRGPSTVIGVSVAAKARSRFRATRSMDAAHHTPPATVPAVADATPRAAAPAGAANPDPRPSHESRATATGASSLFLPPVAPSAASAFSPTAAATANPFALPDAGPAFRAPTTGPPATPAGRRTADPMVPPDQPVAAPPDNFDEAWGHRGFDKNEQELWCANGIRPRDAALADQCRSTGIAAADLSRKLSGRTVLQRLRDGESTTSVWARIQEAEQQPRRAGTRLTGRFQLS